MVNFHIIRPPCRRLSRSASAPRDLSTRNVEEIGFSAYLEPFRTPEGKDTGGGAKRPSAVILAPPSILYERRRRLENSLNTDFTVIQLFTAIARARQPKGRRRYCSAIYRTKHAYSTSTHRANSSGISASNRGSRRAFICRLLDPNFN